MPRRGPLLDNVPPHLDSILTMRIRRVVGYAAVFTAGFLAAMLIQYLLEAPVTAPPPTMAATQHHADDLVDALQSQFRTSSVVIVTQSEQLRLPGHSATGFVEKPFLYDGVRPQDLERMNPPRRLRGLIAPPPPNELKK